MKKIILSIFLTLCGWTVSVRAQDIAAKTNFLQWATATPNLGAEFGLADKWSLELTGAYNPWNLNKDKNRKIKHWLIRPEVRYWLCERFNGHFFGLHTGYTFYNISGVRVLFQGKHTKEHRYQGWGTGVGLSYGYSWILNKRLNMEATVGAGYIYTKYDKYDCVTCGNFKGNRHKHFFGPTKAAVSLIYIIK